MQKDPETIRLEQESQKKHNWKRWGPYLAERQVHFINSTLYHSNLFSEVGNCSGRLQRRWLISLSLYQDNINRKRLELLYARHIPQHRLQMGRRRNNGYNRSMFVF
jgi:hypothetical protein